MQRESLGSRLGFILISAGCAIGIGNVWRFPYLCGQYGGGAFVLVYLFFLFILGLPAMCMEFSVGRASQTSPISMYQKLEPEGSKWHLHGIACLAGNYILMMFYTTVAGWMVQYFFQEIRGTFVGLDPDGVANVFSQSLENPAMQVGFMGIVVLMGCFVNMRGLQAGLERVTKVMMIALIIIMMILAVNSLFLPGASEGIRYLLIPDFKRMQEAGCNEPVILYTQCRHRFHGYFRKLYRKRAVSVRRVRQRRSAGYICRDLLRPDHHPRMLCVRR